MTIATSGELRLFLADVLVGIKSGTIDAEQANAIAKVSAQINQSLAVDIKLSMGGKGGGLIEGARLAGPNESGVPIPEFDADGMAWCDQCDMRVTAEQAESCRSKFCKVKAQ